MKKVKVGDFFIGPGNPLTLVSGPCVIESESSALKAAEFLTSLCQKYPLQFIYKSSYDKANRSSATSFRGPGLEKGLAILQKVKEMFNVPIFTDVHTAEEAEIAAQVCDVIQIPAFLCRQTDLLLAAGKTGCVINVKKGQFLAPWDMGNVIEKIRSTGNEKILLTDRGTSFGYNNLVSDMRAIPIMQEFGYPVFYDATHSVQLPGGHGTRSGGQSKFIPTLSSAAIAAKCDGIYAESHVNPPEAKSDADSVIAFKDLPDLLARWVDLYTVVRKYG